MTQQKPEWEKERRIIKDWKFFACPTEEKEPFFWRWTEQGLEKLSFYLGTELETARKKERDRIVGILEGMREWSQCNDCFDKKHCEGKIMKCQCTCIKNRENRLKEKISEINEFIEKAIPKIKE